MAEHQKYRITERIDSGGMAEVFRGVAESLQGFKKNVAIKRILPHLCKNKKFISMFLDEARLSLHLQHANIVGVFDIGVSGAEGGSQYFIVMEFVDGSHLKGIIESYRRQGKRLKVSIVLYLMMEVCKGLAYAHDITDPENNRALGIVHRDISPPNILISKMGEVKLVDFGLAKATSQLESTDPGVVKGKFSYLSPEAASGVEVDKRADIFAVGILMYELLTGKRLFYGENDYQTVELVRQARVPSLAQQNNEVEAELEAVVRKALARDVNQRYQSAGELQDAIAHYLFSRGLKVTSRDIAQMVKDCVRERQQSQPIAAPVKNLIDNLIQDELVKFTSLEGPDSGGADSSPTGSQPLSPDEIGSSGSRPLDGGSFIDTREWATNEDPTIADSQVPHALLMQRGPQTGGSASMSGANGHGHTSGAYPKVTDSQKFPRVATPIETSPRGHQQGESSGVVESLEKMLEPDPSLNRRTPQRGGKGFWIALVALLLVSGTAVYYIVTTRVLNHP
jgi:eukaryotic-like serine/threonine-protein kinase